ncbi:hypothetical protein SDC9_189175 [bioreactor metagenome]|uniref:Uncharacterized protein n=1 Tax=bioreactor metagenome TaxID=1076179 RepID=A0A645HRF5_9ZZZZ
MRLIKIYWSIIWVINIMLFFFYMNSELTDWKLRSDHFLILNLFVFLIGAAILSLHYLYKANINKAVATALLITILLPNAFLDFRYVFLDRTTIYRDAMISMGSKINGKVVVGGFAYAFRMYNTSIPVLNFYMTRYSPDVEAADKYHQYFDQLFADGIGSYSIGVAQDTTEEDVAYMNYMEKHGLQLEDEYQFKDLIDENIGLFAPRP